MKIQPLFDRILVARQNEEEKTAGGIVIPDTAKEKTHRGKVVSVGSGKLLEDGKVRPMTIKVGDQVLFEKYAGTEIKIDGTDCVVIREEEVLGIVNTK